MATLNLNYLEDLNVFNVNKLDYYSDHKVYKSKQEYLNKKSSFYQSLNGEYKFKYFASPKLIGEEYLKEDFDISSLDIINVPGCIELNYTHAPQYVNQMYPWDGSFISNPPHIDIDRNPTGIYFKDFDVDNLDEDLNISFEAGAMALYVYLNGEFVGYSEDSFLPARFNLNKYLKHHNRLTVVVCSYSKAAYIEGQDFWRLTGLYRDVYLYSTPKAHILDIKVLANLENNYQDGHLFLNVKSKNVKEINATLSYKGQEICKKSFKDLLDIKVKDVHPWSAEVPNLYDLELEVIDENGEVSEYIHQDIGFRTFEIKNKVMLINGKRVVFRGINRHEFSSIGGRHVTKEEMDEDIRFMKANNINAVRTSHYPNDTYWYELCDKYGIYLIDEVNMESHGSWTKMDVFDPSWNVPGSLPSWEKIVLDRVKHTFERDKNHPSIVIWSIGNESWAGTNTVKMHDLFNELDKTRPVHYESCMHVREFRNSTDIESYMYAKVPEIEDYLNNNPDKPYISCEYSHAMANSLGGIDEYIKLEDKYELYQGGFIWDYMDQGIIVDDKWLYGGDFFDRPHDNSFCCNGVRYCNRSDSPKVCEMKQVYAPVVLTVKKNKVEIYNKNLFISTSIYNFVVTILKNGKFYREYSFNEDVAPLSKKVYSLDLEGINEYDEYVVKVSAHLKDDYGLLQKGHLISFGEDVIGQYKHSVDENNNNYKVFNSDLNIGVHGDKFSVLFSKREGGIISLKYNGQEWVNKPLLPTFFRANTDNDRGNRFNITSSIWYSVDQFLNYTNKQYKVIDDEKVFTIVYTYILMNSMQNKVDVTYKVYGDGNIEVNAHYYGANNLPEFALFGMNLAIPLKVESFKYYGLGDQENYIDRHNGTSLGIYQTTPMENVSKYIEPQECGNRSEVRYCKLYLNNHHSLKIYMKDKPLNVSVLPYSNIELEFAKHIHELNKSPNYTYLRVCGFMRGVGGDDSWGAPVLSKYCLDATKDYEFSFYIQGE